MSHKLLPCPFCGGTDLNFHTGNIDGWIATVVCRTFTCSDMRGPWSQCKYGDLEEAKDDAAEQWNRRLRTVANTPHLFVGPTERAVVIRTTGDVLMQKTDVDELISTLQRWSQEVWPGA